jgi:hypothetical protein
MKPTFTEPTIYRLDDVLFAGPTLLIRQVDDIMCVAAISSDRHAVFDGIGSKVTFKNSPSLKKLFHATDIDQCAHYILIFTQSYIESRLVKLGRETKSVSSTLLPPNSGCAQVLMPPPPALWIPLVLWIWQTSMAFNTLP